MIPEVTTSKRTHTRPTLALTAVLTVALAAVALGSTGSLKLNASANATLGKTIVINPAGRSLYSLSGETTHHVICKQACVRFWPPLIVPSSTTKVSLGSGVHGKVGLLRRSNGSLQVTLRGMRLFRYSGDHAKGDANGEGIEEHPGIWHAVTAAAVAPTPPPSTTSPPYSY
jgi:predicted lipoprotein with Yx(FWY)xxD motif